ncbi:hypothetical protein C8R45DRAFT_942897 [Mycena sanguinolenta]|nr:hypothetical protein C8R45DRAFT_945542 [Mycena sanguinolenta]KAJ6458306.1 hypothetical protein C8R45DRAFT_942897 [Mycena sanguinolenta]
MPFCHSAWWNWVEIILPTALPPPQQSVSACSHLCISWYCGSIASGAHSCSSPWARARRVSHFLLRILLLARTTERPGEWMGSAPRQVKRGALGVRGGLVDVDEASMTIGFRAFCHRNPFNFNSAILDTSRTWYFCLLEPISTGRTPEVNSHTVVTSDTFTVQTFPSTVTEALASVSFQRTGRRVAMNGRSEADTLSAKSDHAFEVQHQLAVLPGYGIPQRLKYSILTPMLLPIVPIELVYSECSNHTKSNEP